MRETKTLGNLRVPVDRLGRAGRLAGMMLLGLLLAGCDACGNWVSATSGEGEMCRGGAPRPQSLTPDIWRGAPTTTP